jgi:hypothetical protein
MENKWGNIIKKIFYLRDISYIRLIVGYYRDYYEQKYHILL